MESLHFFEAAIRMALQQRSRHNTVMNVLFQRIICTTALVVVASPGSCLEPQQGDVMFPESPQLNGRYRLEIRVLAGRSAADRLRDRDWSKSFRTAGYRVTIATDDGRDNPGIRYRTSGRRVVEVIGLLNRTGVLNLGDRKFRLNDAPQLKTFLDELAKHGPEGPTRLRPTWGLSVSQYEEVLKLLSVKITNEIELSSPEAVVQALNLSSAFTVTRTAESRSVLSVHHQKTRSIDLRPISSGTGLAIALAQFGMGFRVMEHPRKGLLLEIDVGDESSNLWPTGWKNQKSMTAVLPRMFKRVTVDLPDENVADIIDRISDLVEIPCFCSYQQLENAGIQFNQIRYSAPVERRSPAGVLRSIAGRHRMGIEPRTDETGQLFLWCTTADDHKAWKSRFAHMVPGKNQ
ncbi:MAG: hypothetical protein MK102_14885 [Fuerstiella sp.]|nr:hypothetical protein [Fuerstiella sp.]